MDNHGRTNGDFYPVPPSTAMDYTAWRFPYSSPQLTQNYNHGSLFPSATCSGFYQPGIHPVYRSGEESSHYGTWRFRIVLDFSADISVLSVNFVVRYLQISKCCVCSVLSYHILIISCYRKCTGSFLPWDFHEKWIISVLFLIMN